MITEYDVTSSSNTSEYVTQDGSDWMDGVPSAYESRGPHDAEVDSRGFVWIVDSQDNRVRTISKLDPKTGAIKDFKLDQRPPTGWAMGSHGIVIDENDIAWFNADGGLGRMDTRTEKLEWFDPPPPMARVGGTLDVDGCAGGRRGRMSGIPSTVSRFFDKLVQRGYATVCDCLHNGLAPGHARRPADRARACPRRPDVIRQGRAPIRAHHRRDRGRRVASSRPSHGRDQNRLDLRAGGRRGSVRRHVSRSREDRNP